MWHRHFCLCRAAERRKKSRSAVLAAERRHLSSPARERWESMDATEGQSRGAATFLSANAYLARRRMSPLRGSDQERAAVGPSPSRPRLHSFRRFAALRPNRTVRRDGMPVAPGPGPELGLFETGLVAKTAQTEVSVPHERKYPAVGLAKMLHSRPRCLVRVSSVFSSFWLEWAWSSTSSSASSCRPPAA
jgi:hypothetical protein